MAASQVSICNIALQLVGAKRIIAIDDGSEQANSCDILYDVTRQELLRTHLWRFARARASLPALSTDPLWGYDKAFLKPTDSLSIFAIDTGSYSTRGVRWTVEGDSIIANTAAPLNILYGRDITDESLFDVLFVMVFAHQLAVYLCEPLTQDNKKNEMLERKLGQTYGNALAADAFESLEMIEADGNWITNRALTGGSVDPTLIWDGY